MPARSSAELFSWSDGRTVLFVERRTDGWIVSRGWQTGDQLKDVRRWAFDSRRRVIGQIRRLVRDSTGDQAIADELAELIAAWIDESPST